MRAFVFWSGVYNLVFGMGLFFPALGRAVGIRQPDSVFFSELIALLVVFLGVLLILCSRNLAARASLVYWIGVLLVVAFIHQAWFGFFRAHGAMVGVSGLIDLAIGLGYLLGLPKSLGRSHSQLLCDRA